VRLAERRSKGRRSRNARQSGNELFNNSRMRRLGGKLRLSGNALLTRIPRRVLICGQLRGDDRRTTLGNTCAKTVSRQSAR
jgi:hypothetical protein